MNDAAERVKQWKHPITHEPETAIQYRKRMILNTAIKDSLKKYPEFYKSELEGDNYIIVRNVLMFGEPSSKFMKVTLNKKLEAHVKTKAKTYQEYESELREMWDELACLGKVVSEEDKTLKLIAGMEDDRRYHNVVKEVCTSDSNYGQCHTAFMQEAHIQKDLWREQKKFSTQGDINSADRTDTKRAFGKGSRGGRGKGRGQTGRGGRGSRDQNKTKSKQNACPFFLAHGKCRYGDSCNRAHFTLEEFQAAQDSAGNHAKQKGKAKKGQAKGREVRVKRTCFQWQNEGNCDYGDDCKFIHDEDPETIQMAETDQDGFNVGSIIIANDVPLKSVFKGMVGTIIGKKGDRYLIDPRTEMASKDALYLKTTGLKARNLKDKRGENESIMSADRLTAYDFKAAFDPAADYTITPTEENLVKGSVRTLEQPLRLGGFQKGSPVIEFKRVGLLCIMSNTGMSGYMSIPAYVSPLAKRTLVAQAQLDELDWYLELGGGVARVRRKGSQANFLVLARFQETHRGLPVLDVTEDMKFGEQDLRRKLGAGGGKKYPIPDELLVTDLDATGFMDQPSSYGQTMTQDGDVCLAQRYSQQERLDLMHQMLGHTNYQRLALMKHWDGDGPKPSSRVLARACAVCAISKAHAIGARKESFEFKDDSILGHVYADLSTEMGQSIEGYKHFLSIYVQGSAKYFAFYLRTRGEGNQWLLVWLRRAHTMHHPRRTKFLHVDNELNTNAIKRECLTNGTQLIVNQRSAHEHNAKGERPIRAITEIMRTTCLQGGALIAPYWPIGVQNAISVLGLLPPMRKMKTKRDMEKVSQRPLTPNEIWKQVEYPSYKEQMRNVVTPFCEVTAIPDDMLIRGGKTHNPGIPALYLGPVTSNEISKRAHLVLRYDTGRRFTTRHVIPNSDRFPLIHGPSPGLKMHPAILESNKIRQKGDRDDLQPNFQEKGFDPDLHKTVDWDGDEAERQAKHEAVNQRLKQATGQVDQESDESKDIVIVIDDLEEDTNVPPEESMHEDVEKSQEGQPHVSEDVEKSQSGQPHEIDKTEKSREGQPQDDLGVGDEENPPPEEPDEGPEMPSLEHHIQEDLTEAWHECQQSSTESPFASHEEKADGAEIPPEGDDAQPEKGASEEKKEPEKEITEESNPDDEKKVNKKITWAKKLTKTKTIPARTANKAKRANKRQEEKAPKATKRTTRLSVRDTGTYSRAFLARNPQQKYPQGTAVMSRWGPAIVQRVLADGTDAELTWPNYEDPGQIYIAKVGSQFWLPEDRPDETYDALGVRIAQGDINLLENSDEKTFRGYEIHNLVGNVKARDINLSMPKHRHQIQHHVLRPLCDDAEVAELHGLIEKGAFGDPQPLPKNYRKIPVMWVYLAKDSDDGSGDFKKMKARLTVRGDLEKQDVSQADAYSPVSHPVTYKILLVVHMGDKRVKYFVFDVEQAFLSTQHKRIVFVGHAPGYKVIRGRKGLYYKKLKVGEHPPTTVLKLLLALYGGKECSRLFWEEFRRWHLEYGFKSSHYEKCYLYLIRGEQFIKIAFHVDDGMVAQRGDALWKQYIKDIAKRFSMIFEDLEKRTKFLGNNFHLNREQNYCLIEQSPSIDKMLQKFEMTDCNDDVKSPFPSRWPTDADLPKTKEEIDESKKFDMRSAVGFLNWIEGGTKPELARPLKCAARYASNHGEKMREMVKRMMRWCKRTREHTMVLRGIAPTERPCVQIFTDASHATCPDTRRSITGVVVKINGCTVLWKSLNQRIVSHSSTESELMALDKGATIGVYVRWLVEIIGQDVITPTQIFVDNQSAITLASNPVHPDRNLHVHARYFYVRDLVDQGIYKVCYVKTGDQLADLMCVFKSHEGFSWLYALITNVAKCVKTTEGDKIVYKWKITPKERYIN